MKTVLFLTNSLGLGGSEKCMQEMICRMDTKKYHITVLSLVKSQNYVPFGDDIQVLNGYADFELLNMPTSAAVPLLVKAGRLGLAAAKVKFSIQCRMNRAHVHISKFFWEDLEKYIPPIKQFYDVVISYGQGVPTYFLKEKVSAGKKIAWLNTELDKAGYDLQFVRPFYQAADCIVTDSQNGRNAIGRFYPELQDRTSVFPNLLDVETIRRKGESEPDPFAGETAFRIVSVGRLAEAKAFHLAVEAAHILERAGTEFKWTIVGEGGCRPELERLIGQYHLEDRVFLVGARENPYPYMKHADCYVQTSIYEGSCMTVNEAMIFCKPIVSTDFPAIFEKIRDRENGLICHMDGQDIADKIMELIRKPDLCAALREDLRAHPIDYSRQMALLDRLLGTEA